MTAHLMMFILLQTPDDLDVIGAFPDEQQQQSGTFFRYRDYYKDRGIKSGIELCTLADGEQLRLDLLERWQ